MSQRMKHIRFVSTNKSICIQPEMLGKDLVLTDRGDNPWCKVCEQLLYAHNAKEAKGDVLNFQEIQKINEKYKGEVSHSSEGISSNMLVTVLVLLLCVVVGILIVLGRQL